MASGDSNGVVTGIKAGTAVITATLDNGQSATCTVTVTADGGKTDENGGNPPATGETAPWAFGLAVLSLSAAALISAFKACDGGLSAGRMQEMLIKELEQ